MRKLKDSLYDALVKEDRGEFSDLLKDALIERLEKKAFALYAEELKRLIEKIRQ